MADHVSLRKQSRVLVSSPYADTAPRFETHLLRRHGSLARPPQLVDRLGVIPEVLLAADEDDRQARAEVEDFGDPLLLDVVERVGRVDGEADEDNVRVGVRQRTESVVVLLAGGIPQRELDALAIDDNIGDAVCTDS